MAAVGCTTCLLGMGDDFYCGPFCVTAKILLALSATGFVILLRPELKSLSKNIIDIFRKHSNHSRMKARNDTC